MSKESTEQRLRKLIADHFCVDVSQVTDDYSISDNADSLDRVELVMAVEDEFDIEIDQDKAEELHNINTVGLLISEVQTMIPV